MLDCKSYNIEWTFDDMLLGTVPQNKEVFSKYIAGKHAEVLARGKTPMASGAVATAEEVQASIEEEIQSVKDAEERGCTGFHRSDDGLPFLYDYAVKGFFCEAARTIQKQPDVPKQLADKVKRFLFVSPRRIVLVGTESVIERPLRAMTAQGPRVTVVRSEAIENGVLGFKLVLLRGSEISEGTLRSLLDYGQFSGAGQWRSGGYGRFSYVFSTGNE